MKNDFIFIQNICNDLQQLSYHNQKCMKLLQLLDDVCLQFFHKKIFLYIKHHSHDVWILSHHESIALADEIALTWSSLQQTLKISEENLCMIWDNNMHVQHINVLFAWFWDWNDDTENAKSEWLHWNQKSYHMLFQQCFTQIKTIYDKNQAWIWHDIIKKLFVWSHWMFFYSFWKIFFSQNKHDQLQWWCSVHDEFLHYFLLKRKHFQDQSHWILESWKIRLLSIDD